MKRMEMTEKIFMMVLSSSPDRYISLSMWRENFSIVSSFILTTYSKCISNEYTLLNKYLNYAISSLVNKLPLLSLFIDRNISFLFYISVMTLIA